MFVPAFVFGESGRVSKVRKAPSPMPGRVVQQPVEASDSPSVVGAEHGEEGSAVVGSQRSLKTTGGGVTDTIVKEPAVSESVFVLLIGFYVVSLGQINEEDRIEGGEGLASERCLDSRREGVGLVLGNPPEDGLALRAKIWPEQGEMSDRGLVDPLVRAPPIELATSSP